MSRVETEVIPVIDGPNVWNAQCPADGTELLTGLTSVLDGFRSTCSTCRSKWVMILGRTRADHLMMKVSGLLEKPNVPPVPPSPTPRYDPEGRILVASTPSSKTLTIITSHVSRLLEDLTAYAAEAKHLGNELPLSPGSYVGNPEMGYSRVVSRDAKPVKFGDTNFLGFGASPGTPPVPGPFKPIKIPPLSSLLPNLPAIPPYLDMPGYQDAHEGGPRVNPVKLLNDEEKKLCDIFNSMVQLFDAVLVEYTRAWEQSAPSFEGDPTFDAALMHKRAEVEKLKKVIAPLRASAALAVSRKNPYPVGSIQWVAGAFPPGHLEKLVEIFAERQGALLASAFVKAEAAKTMDGLEKKRGPA